MNDFPKTIAIIMDGNRRWAKKNKVSMFAGHKKGSKTIKNIISTCVKLNIKELTIFAFSTENWNREITEVNSLLKLIEYYLKSEIAEMNLNNIKFKSIGETSIFNQTIQNLIKSAENITCNNTGLQLNVCLNYGGIADLIHATKSISEKIVDKEISIDQIDYNCIKENLLSSQISDVDLLIRTSGENRISNFLPIQLSYTEMYFTETLWPDFTEDDLLVAFDYFSKRERRFGSSLSVSK